MKLGLNLKSQLWTDDRLRMARQLGCESIVAWVPLSEGDGVWHENDLKHLVRKVHEFGMDLAAVENFHPAHWDHIVLGESGREEQIEKIKQTIRNVGAAGIPCMGYNFSICGVQGYFAEQGNMDGRGMSSTKRFNAAHLPSELPANQDFWFNTKLEKRSPEGFLKPVGEKEMWERFEWFLERVLPTAEAAGVKLCAHPDDPPVPFLRQMYRPLHSIEGLRRLINSFDSKSNCLEFCQGTISTMAGVDIYAVIEEFAAKERIGYIHFRNTSGTLPEYSEVFIDNGYVNMQKAINLYQKHGFTGTLIPDHTPIISSAAPWDSGMAYALGYIRGLLHSGDMQND